MKKKFSLTLTVAGRDFEPRSVDVLESNNLIEILAQLPLIIRKVSEQEIEFLKRHLIAADDLDIPF